MPQKVPEDSICMVVVKNWQRLMCETADERDHQLSSIHPFPPFEQTYEDILSAVREGSRAGLYFYRMMVKVSSGFSFSEGVPCEDYCKHVKIK